MTTEIMSVIGAALSALAAAYSVYRLRVKREAEDTLLRTLGADREFARLVNEQRNLLVHARAQSLSDEELHLVVRYLDHVLRKLHERERTQLREAIEQPSLKGRANYVSKLLNEIIGARRPEVPAA